MNVPIEGPGLFAFLVVAAILIVVLISTLFGSKPDLDSSPREGDDDAYLRELEDRVRELRKRRAIDRSNLLNIGVNDRGRPGRDI